MIERRSRGNSTKVNMMNRVPVTRSNSMINTVKGMQASTSKRHIMEGTFIMIDEKNKLSEVGKFNKHSRKLALVDSKARFESNF